jgi:DNA-directed RNA polymerase subunit M/transcription elongation factor TFIIS
MKRFWAKKDLPLLAVCVDDVWYLDCTVCWKTFPSIGLAVGRDHKCVKEKVTALRQDWKSQKGGALTRERKLEIFQAEVVDAILRSWSRTLGPEDLPLLVDYEKVSDSALQCMGCGYVCRTENALKKHQKAKKKKKKKKGEVEEDNDEDDDEDNDEDDDEDNDSDNDGGKEFMSLHI